MLESYSNGLDIFEDELLAFILNALKDAHFLLSSSWLLTLPCQRYYFSQVHPLGQYRCCSVVVVLLCDTWFFFSLGDPQTEHHLFGQTIHLYPASTKNHNIPYNGILFSGLKRKSGKIRLLIHKITWIDLKYIIVNLKRQTKRF